MRKDFITSKSNADVLALLVEPVAEHADAIHATLPRRVDDMDEAHEPECRKAHGSCTELSPVVALLQSTPYARCCRSEGWDALVGANTEEVCDAARDILLAREARRDHVRLLNTSNGPYHSIGNGGGALQVLYKSGQLALAGDVGRFRPLVEAELAALGELALHDLRHPSSGLVAQMGLNNWRGQMFAEAAAAWANGCDVRGLAVISRSRLRGETFAKVAWLTGEVLAQSEDLMLVATGAEMIKLVAQGSRSATPVPTDEGALAPQAARLALQMLEGRDITVKVRTTAREAEAHVRECISAARAALG